jgi:hypothetical protein
MQRYTGFIVFRNFACWIIPTLIGRTVPDCKTTLDLTPARTCRLIGVEQKYGDCFKISLICFASVEISCFGASLGLVADPERETTTEGTRPCARSFGAVRCPVASRGTAWIVRWYAADTTRRHAGERGIVGSRRRRGSRPPRRHAIVFRFRDGGLSGEERGLRRVLGCFVCLLG